MKNLLFLFSLILLVFSCKKDCDIVSPPQEEIALVNKAFYDSEWGGIKDQILDCIGIYECLTETNCTIPEEYMDTIHYVFESEDVRHEKALKYSWEFLESDNSDITKLQVWLGDMTPGKFENSDFYYKYNMIGFSITIEDHALDDDYHIGLDNWTIGKYINTEFDETLNSISECGLRVNKSDYTIESHSCNEKPRIHYDNPCEYYGVTTITYDIEYSVK